MIGKSNIKPTLVKQEDHLDRSIWYGPSLLTFLTTAEETGGTYTLIKCTLRKGFEPPLHIHSREEESYLVLDGEIDYEVGERTIHAKAGDFVILPRDIPHTFKLISETVTHILLITPSGFEEFFRQFSRPAESLELPPVPTKRPSPEFFEKMSRLNAKLGVIMLPNL